MYLVNNCKNLVVTNYKDLLLEVFNESENLDNLDQLNPI